MPVWLGNACCQGVQARLTRSMSTTQVPLLPQSFVLLGAIQRPDRETKSR